MPFNVCTYRWVSIWLIGVFAQGGRNTILLEPTYSLYVEDGSVQATLKAPRSACGVCRYLEMGAFFATGTNRTSHLMIPFRSVPARW